MEVANQQLSGRLTEGQQYILKVMSLPVTENELNDIGKMIARYFADKLTRLADEAWERNGWTDEEIDRLLHTRMRSSKKKTTTT